MPTYEYLCQSCGHRFEIWQKITDDALTECPRCAGHIRRVLFPAGIVFKGSGFYSTESRPAAASVPEATNATDNKAPESGSPLPASEASPSTTSAGEKNATGKNGADKPATPAAASAAPAKNASTKSESASE